MNKFLIMSDAQWGQQDESRKFYTLTGAVSEAEKCMWPMVVVEYKGQTSVKYETKFVTEPSDPFTKGEKR
jgi:hypothetical protein